MGQRLKDKVTLITGAGNGIGRASALRFGQEGAIVYVNDCNPEGAEETVSMVRAAGGIAEVAVADATDAEAIAAIIGRIKQEQGRIDILFNNAGGDRNVGPTLDRGIADYRRIVALNLDSVFYATYAALPFMIEQGGGVILTTSSGAGINAVAGLASYGAAKAGAASLMKSIANEFGHQGIRANTIAPGPMDTPGLRNWLDTIPDGAAIFAKHVPVGRLGTAEDIAAAAVFLASDDAAFISGVLLPVDGAIHARLSSPNMPPARKA